MTKKLLKPLFIFIIILGLFLAGCSPEAEPSATDAPQMPATMTPLVVESDCPTERIAFDQDSGCLNDGSFEFCIPADDEAALSAVLDLALRVVCVESSGRARCNTDSQLLCMVQTEGMCDAASSSAMTAAGWQTVCNFASLPFVAEIVPTWFE